jgi:D-psicose/D-tagatose/L-ribulose 3-epimerase
MAKLRYSVHAYAWTNSWSNKTLDLIDRAKALGFDFIEIPLMEIDLVDPVKIKERASRVGINVLTSTVLGMKEDLTAEDESTRRNGVKYLLRCVDAVAEMGATLLGGPTYSAIGRHLDIVPTQVYWDRAAAGLKEVARYAQGRKVTLALEPINRYETFLVNTGEQALRLIEMINEPNVGVHLDTYHMNIEENDFYTPTLQMGKKLAYYHVSESHRGTPGEGVVDWEGMFRALAKISYQGVLGLESYLEIADAMRPATCIWRKLAPSTEYLLTTGLEYFKILEQKHYRQ